MTGAEIDAECVLAEFIKPGERHRLPANLCIRTAKAVEWGLPQLSAPDLKAVPRAVSWRVEAAPPVIAKVHKPAKVKADPLQGFHEVKVNGKTTVVEAA